MEGPKIRSGDKYLTDCTSVYKEKIAKCSIPVHLLMDFCPQSWYVVLPRKEVKTVKPQRKNDQALLAVSTFLSLEAAIVTSSETTSNCANPWLL